MCVAFDVTHISHILTRSYVCVRVCVYKQQQQQVIPAFGIAEGDLKARVRNGIIPYGPSFENVVRKRNTHTHTHTHTHNM